VTDVYALEFEIGDDLFGRRQVMEDDLEIGDDLLGSA